MDLILTTDDDSVLGTCAYPPFPNCHHCVIMCSYVLSCYKYSDLPKKCKLLDWYNGRYDLIRFQMRNIDWDFEFNELCIEDMYNRFLRLISAFISLYVPQKQQTRRTPYRTHPPSY